MSATGHKSPKNPGTSAFPSSLTPASDQHEGETDGPCRSQCLKVMGGIIFRSRNDDITDVDSTIKPSANQNRFQTPPKDFLTPSITAQQAGTDDNRGKV